MITIRPFRPEDAPAMVTVFREAVSTIAVGRYTPEQIEAWLKGTPDEAETLARCSDGRLTLVAEVQPAPQPIVAKASEDPKVPKSSIRVPSPVSGRASKGASGEAPRRAPSPKSQAVAPGASTAQPSVVAFIDLEEDGHIDLAYAHPTIAGRGVYQGLYAELEDQARARGLTELHVEASEMARRFFEKQGFEVSMRRDFVTHGVPIHNYAMRKSLIPHGPTETGQT